MNWKFYNCCPLSLPARTFLSQCYFYNVFLQSVLHTIASNSYKVRGCEDRKWHWILRLTAVKVFAASSFVRSLNRKCERLLYGKHYNSSKPENKENDANATYKSLTFQDWFNFWLESGRSQKFKTFISRSWRKLRAWSAFERCVYVTWMKCNVPL